MIFRSFMVFSFGRREARCEGNQGTDGVGGGIILMRDIPMSMAWAGEGLLFSLLDSLMDGWMDGLMD